MNGKNKRKRNNEQNETKKNGNKTRRSSNESSRPFIIHDGRVKACAGNWWVGWLVGWLFCCCRFGGAQNPPPGHRRETTHRSAAPSRRPAALRAAAWFQSPNTTGAPTTLASIISWYIKKQKSRFRHFQRVGLLGCGGSWPQWAESDRPRPPCKTPPEESWSWDVEGRTWLVACATRCDWLTGRHARGKVIGCLYLSETLIDYSLWLLGNKLALKLVERLTAPRHEPKILSDRIWLN